MKITGRTPIEGKWLAPRENAVETVLYLYSTICHRFKVDANYGDKFVAENQNLIGKLVNAAVIEVSKENK